MVETDAVERVLESKTALDLMGFNHTLKDILNGDILPSASQVVGDREDSAEIVRRVTPFRRKPTVVEVQPPDRRADIECTANGVKLIVGARDLRACKTEGSH